MVQRRNPVPANRAPLQPITTSRPGELVTMDIVEYPQSARGYRYCLVMIDHFTKWLELFPLRNQKAETVAKKVFDGWIPRHGTPEQLHHDQGKNLSAKMIEEVCSFAGSMEHSHYTISPPVRWGIGKKHLYSEHAHKGRGRGPKKLGPIRAVVLFCIQHCSP